MLWSVGSQLTRQSVAPSSHRAYWSSFWSWTAFRGSIGEIECFDAVAFDAEKIQAIRASLWRGVYRRAIKSVLLRENHRPCYTSIAPTYKRSCRRLCRLLSRSERGCTVARRRRGPKNIAPPDFVGYTIGRTGPPGFVIGPGRPSSLGVSRVGLFCFVARSNEIFASSTRIAHAVHCLTRRYVSLFQGGAAVDFV